MAKWILKRPIHGAYKRSTLDQKKHTQSKGMEIFHDERKKRAKVAIHVSGEVDITLRAVTRDKQGQAFHSDTGTNPTRGCNS